MRIVYQSRTGHHEITVLDSEELDGEKGRFRLLQFSDGAVQGAMDLNRPERILFEYPRAMLHLMEHNHGAFGRVFVVGHGIGSLARHGPDKRFKIAELDPEVVEVSRRFFAYPFDNVTVGDGRAVLAEEPPAAYDYIVLDAFTSKGTPRQLTSLEFFRLVREKLEPDSGFVLLNLMGRGEHDPLIGAVHTTLGEVFDTVRTFAIPVKGAAGRQNVLMAAGSRPIAYQGRRMAGFVEIAPGEGYVITDRS